MGEYTRIPVEKAMKPFDGARVLTNRWWVVVDECLLFYRGFSPQCNAIESITKRLAAIHPSGEVRFLETAYVKEI